MPAVGYDPAIAHVSLLTTRLPVDRACTAVGGAKARVEGVVGHVDDIRGQAQTPCQEEEATVEEPLLPGEPFLPGKVSFCYAFN